MQINAQQIKDLNPCRARWDNFIKHYPNFSGSMGEFFALTRISFYDKMWVFSRVLSVEASNKFWNKSINIALDNLGNDFKRRKFEKNLYFIQNYRSNRTVHNKRMAGSGIQNLISLAILTRSWAGYVIYYGATANLTIKGTESTEQISKHLRDFLSEKAVFTLALEVL